MLSDSYLLKPTHVVACHKGSHVRIVQYLAVSAIALLRHLLGVGGRYQAEGGYTCGHGRRALAREGIRGTPELKRSVQPCRKRGAARDLP